MVVTVTCPSEEQLLAFAAGGSADVSMESHLRDCATCRQRLAKVRSEIDGLRDALTGAMSDSPTDGSSLAPGTGSGGKTASAAGQAPVRIGKYKVVCPLGAGGQGQIFRAWDADLQKDVVIKLALQPLPVGGMARAGLGDEGRLLAELDHPGIARVHYLGVHRSEAGGADEAAEYPYLVMEFVRGRNLRQFAEQSRPTPRTAAGIVAQVARALAAAHRKGAIHQDIKPQNILIDESGVPRLIDFGLARLEQAWSDSIRPLGGTIAYMSPEQARAYRQTRQPGEETEDSIGAASDLFSLGAVLYFLLTGKAPYAGSTSAESKAPVDVLDRACRGDWDRAPLREAGAAKLSAIVERAMALEPRDRYPNADAMAADLESYLRRSRRVGLIAVAGGALLAGIASGSAWYLTRPTPAVVTAPDKPDFAAITSPLKCEVQRNGKWIDAREAGDVVNDDPVLISASIAPGYYGALLLCGSSGKTDLLASIRPDESERTLQPRTAIKISGPPGTEVFVVCARRAGPVGLSEFAKAQPRQDAWTQLPSGAVLLLTQDAIRDLSKTRDVTAVNDVDGVRQRLLLLSKGLEDRFQVATQAIAVPHDEP